MRTGAKNQPVEIEERVAVDEEEVFVESVSRQRQGAGSAGRARFDHRLDAHAANGTSVVDGREITRPISAQQQGALDAVPARLIQQVVEEWPTADVEHRLGSFARQPAQPTAKAADQKNSLLDVHATVASLGMSQLARQSILSSRD